MPGPNPEGKAAREIAEEAAAAPDMIADHEIRAAAFFSSLLQRRLEGELGGAVQSSLVTCGDVTRARNHNSPCPPPKGVELGALVYTTTIEEDFSDLTFEAVWLTFTIAGTTAELFPNWLIATIFPIEFSIQ